MGAKKIVIVTPEKKAQINPQNLEIWRRYLIGKNTKLSDVTKENYESDMMQFFIYILDNYENRNIFDIDTEEMAEIIEDYIAFCTSVLGNKDKRLSRRLSSISSLYIYYKKKRKIKENPVELLERPRIAKGKYEIKQTFLTKEQVETIREKLKELGNLQLELFFEFGLSTMARVNAISNVRIDQIDFNEECINNVLEKEGYLVTLYPSERCFNLINQWLEQRKQNGIENDYLFIYKNQKGEWDRTPKIVFQKTWIKKIGKLIGIPELHCHDLRHSGSDLLFKSGLPIEKVSSLLNHRGLDVTRQHYLTEDKKKMKEEKRKFEI